VDAALFDTGNDVTATTRIFPSSSMAKTWFNRAAGTKAARCSTNQEMSG
jgi:hypothetical protein